MTQEPPGYAPGLYTGLSNEHYHAAPGISNSGLALIGRCPAIYYGRRLDPRRPPEEEKGGQLDGTLAHCAILEPDEFDKRYIVGPDVHRNTNAWKSFVAGHPGQVVIKRQQRECAFAQAASVRAIPDVAEALASGIAEPSGFWIDEQTGVLCKVRPDWVHSVPGGDILFDVKTYSDASPDDFTRQIARKLYYMQDAWYRDGWTQVTKRPVAAFVFIAVETEYPYAASAVMLDEDSVEEGRILYRRNLDIYAQCKNANEWPGYVQGIAEVRLPAYAFGK